MSVHPARTRLAGLAFTLNSSGRVARGLHSSNHRRANAKGILDETDSTAMREHLDNIEQMHVSYMLHGDMDLSGPDLGELDVQEVVL